MWLSWLSVSRPRQSQRQHKIDKVRGHYTSFPQGYDTATELQGQPHSYSGSAIQLQHSYTAPQPQLGTPSSTQLYVAGTTRFSNLTPLVNQCFVSAFQSGEATRTTQQLAIQPCHSFRTGKATLDGTAITYAVSSVDATPDFWSHICSKQPASLTPVPF